MELPDNNGVLYFYFYQIIMCGIYFVPIKVKNEKFKFHVLSGAKCINFDVLPCKLGGHFLFLTLCPYIFKRHLNKAAKINLVQPSVQFTDYYL